MKNRSFIFLVCVSFLTSCYTEYSEEKSSCIHFTRKDFKQHIILENPDTISLEETYNNPASFYLIDDSLVLVNNQPNSSCFIEIFSLNTKKHLLSLATKGIGPEEFISCTCYSISNFSPLFYIQDEQTHSFYVADIKKTLNKKRLHINEKFQYNPEIHPYTRICILNDKYYLGYNMWYLNDSQINNGVPELKKYLKNDSNAKSINTPNLQEYKYFVADVNGGNFILPSKRRIWLTDTHKDKITIYNDSLQYIKTLIGPDLYNIKYDTKKSNTPISFAVFKNNNYFSSYKYWTQTKKHIYLIYEGLNNQPYDPENLKPVEIFKFDLDGNPICNYKLDQYVYHISIDSQEKYLYATTRTSYKEMAFFVRYKL